jgi:hypothetical protein
MTPIPDFHEEMDRFQNHIPTWVSHNLNRLRRERAIWVLDLRCWLMTFKRCVGQWLVSCISLIVRLRNGRVENCLGYLNLHIVFELIAYDQQAVRLIPTSCKNFLERSDVSFGSKADMPGRICDVRFTPKSGH